MLCSGYVRPNAALRCANSERHARAALLNVLSSTIPLIDGESWHQLESSPRLYASELANNPSSPTFGRKSGAHCGALVLAATHTARVLRASTVPLLPARARPGPTPQETPLIAGKKHCGHAACFSPARRPRHPQRRRACAPRRGGGQGRAGALDANTQHVHSASFRQSAVFPAASGPVGRAPAARGL